MKNSWYISAGKTLTGCWTVNLYKNNRYFTEIQITGLLAGPRFWFKPIEERVKLAKIELMSIASGYEEFDSKVDEKRMQINSFLKD